jgi:uncharacterized protein involved in exopolysaccharide biosynthesis
MLLDTLIVLAKRKKTLIGFPAAAALIAAGISLLMPNIYTATTRILPPQQSQSAAAAMLGQLGSLAGLAGSSLGIKNPSDIYVAMLRSRTIADSLIHRFDLLRVYDRDTLTDARRALERATSVSTSKEGVITVDVDDEDRKRAAELANAYIEELEKLSRTLAVTEAAQRRAFFEGQLKDAREELVRAEAELQKRIETKGLTGVELRSRTQAELMAQLRGQITARQIQVEAMRVFATDDNPEARRLRGEISSMTAELAKLEGGNPKGANGTSDSKSGMESLRRLRDARYIEGKMDLLTKQYEVAKIDEANDPVLIQVLDKAVVPEKKSKPWRSLIVLGVLLLTTVLVVAWILVKEAFDRAKALPEVRARIASLRALVR